MMFDTESREISWAHQPYGKILETAEQDGSVLIIPVGSIEQHGYHLPVATDTLLVDAIAKEGAKRISEDLPILVTPPIWSGFSPHHMPFGGTITLEPNTLLELIDQIVETAIDNGFDSVLLLNGHGGNISIIGTATSMVGKDHPGVQALGVTYFQLAESFIDDIRDSDVGGMGHGGEFETSLMLHLYPQLVDSERLEGTNMDEPYDLSVQDLLVAGPLSVYRPFTEYSESGAIGDPTLATAEKGEKLFNRLGDELESLLRDIHNENT